VTLVTLSPSCARCYRKRFSSCSSDGRLDSLGQSSSSWDSLSEAPPLPPPRGGEGGYSSLNQSPLLQIGPKVSPPETPPPAPQRQPQPQQQQYEDVANVYCEVVIPSSTKRGRPELVKSRSETAFNRAASELKTNTHTHTTPSTHIRTLPQIVNAVDGRRFIW